MIGKSNVKSNSFFDSHHKMERFSALFMALVLVLVGCYAIGVKAHVDNQKVTLSERVLYTDRTAWSLTQGEVSVVDLYRDDNFTKIFILLYMDMTDLPIDANDYEIYMTGSQGTSIQGNPSAGIYVFADTGYMGLFFSEAAGFNSAIYDIVLRNTNLLRKDIEINENGNSFERFNQLRLFANFAGASGTVAEFLNKNDSTTEEIYTELMLKRSAETLKESLNQSLIDMNSEMANINAAISVLTSYNMNVPALPASISGDYVTTEEEQTVSNPKAFNVNMVNLVDSIISTNYNTSISAESIEDISSYKSSDTLYFVTDYVFPGGYQFNYQDLSLTDGVLDDLLSDYSSTTTYQDLVNMKSDEAVNYDSYATVSFGDWYSKTGNRFVYDETTATHEDTAIYNAIVKYETAVRNLHNLKKTYQTSQLPQFLKLESNAKSVSNIFSVRSDVNTVTMY